MKCDNCDLPEGALLGKGYKITVVRQAENNFKRAATVNAWACCEACAVQAIGISQYGKASHKWPVTLAQIRGTAKRDGLMQPCELPVSS